MSFFKNLFGNKDNDQARKAEGNNGVEFLMPVAGEIIDISEIPDPVFSQKMMGDGFGIKPDSGVVYAPTSGEIVSFFPHAVGIKADNGLEYLIHYGLETVALNGEGFDTKVSVGDKVNAGDVILEVDLEGITPKVPSTITPVIFTDINGFTFEAKAGKHDAKSKDAIIIK